MYYKRLVALLHSSYLKYGVRFRFAKLERSKFSYIPSSIIAFSLGFAKNAALDEDVNTNRLMEDCFAAASSIFRIPFVTFGMTSSGFGLRDVSLAYLKILVSTVNSLSL
jgi:hypothetical protein